MPIADLDRGLKALADSAPAYRTAEGYYTGTAAEFFTNAKIAEKIKAAGSPHALAFSAIPVDARQGLLDIAGVSVVDSDTLSATLREKVWDANGLDEEMPDALRQALYFGDYFVTVWDAETEDDEDDDKGVDVFLNSPLTTRIIYSSSNTKKPLYAIKVWEAPELVGPDKKTRYRANLYYRDRIEQWVSSPGKAAQSGADFEPYLEDDDEVDEDGLSTIENPYGKLPVFHLRQGSKPYGQPVHARAFGSQDALTKLNATHLGSVDYTGFPQRYVTMDDNADDADTGDEFIDFDTSGVFVDGQEKPSSTRKEKLKSGPGETWWLHGAKSVGQFDPSSHEPFIEPMKFHVRAMARLTNTPAAEFDVETGEVPSGESYKRAYVGLNRDARVLRRGHGATIERLLAFALEVLGFPGQNVTVTWSPLEVALTKEDWEILGTKVASGVPLRVALVEAGYSDEEVDEWFPNEGPAYSLDMLAKLGTLIASFGQGETLGMGALAVLREQLPDLFTDQAEPVVDLPTADLSTPDGDPVAEAQAAKLKGDALGTFVRAGVSGESAAKALGLGDLDFVAVPVTVRLNDASAGAFESEPGADDADVEDVSPVIEE